MTDLHQAIAQIFIQLRHKMGLSQEELADLAGVHRTYVSQMERALKMPTLATLFKICRALQIQPQYAIGLIQTQTEEKIESYKVRTDRQIQCGFIVTSQAVAQAIKQTNDFMATLPVALYTSVDYKTTSSIIGAIFADKLATLVGAIVNPIEKGHPDIVPSHAQSSTEAELRNYPQGLEVKCTIGNLKTGCHLTAGTSRIANLASLTWQAHHREVGALLGLVWDFVQDDQIFYSPKISAAFYSNQLLISDWGEISGLTDRNTKVTAMLSSGKSKMGLGWLVLLDKPEYLQTYSRLLKFDLD